MSYRRTPFAPGEHYHCYTRGIDGRLTFQDKEDYERFQESLYLCNDIKAFDRTDFLKYPHARIFERRRAKELVAIACYSLMPNHFHIGFQEISEGGSSAASRRPAVTADAMSAVRRRKSRRLVARWAGLICECMEGVEIAEYSQCHRLRQGIAT